jgi:hypothetical protein
MYDNRENMSIGISFFQGLPFLEEAKKRIKSSKFIRLGEGLYSISGGRGRD